jgi:hypothetical protein
MDLFINYILKVYCSQEYQVALWNKIMIWEIQELTNLKFFTWCMTVMYECIRNLTRMLNLVPCVSILQSDWQPTYTLEFLHSDVIRHCYTITECYHILQYEVCQDSHNTSNKKWESFRFKCKLITQLLKTKQNIKATHILA